MTPGRDRHPDAADFVPRWTWRALRAERRRSRRRREGNLLPMLLALAASLFCFSQTFLALAGVAPARSFLEGGEASHGTAVQTGLRASVWLVAAAGFLGLAGVLADAPWVPKVRFRWRGGARPDALHVPEAPATRAAAAEEPRRDAVLRPPPTTDDLVAALARPEPPRRPVPWTPAEALGARALVELLGPA